MFVGIVVLTITLHVSPPLVQAWGQDGHEIVGNLAYHLLSNHTRATVDHILGIQTITTASPPSTLVDSNLRGHLHVRDNSNNNNDDDNHSKEDKNTPLGAVANWADHVRFTKAYHWSTPLHYIDIHDNLVNGGCPVFDPTDEQSQQCHFDYTRDCAKDFCVAGAIVNYTKYLKEQHQQQLLSSLSTTINDEHVRKRNHQQQQASNNPLQNSIIARLLQGSASMIAPWSSLVTFPEGGEASRDNSPTENHCNDDDNLVRESLMFLTHFVGDIHQPLHSARTTDKGGNTIFVTFDHSNAFHSHHPLELHAVWDSTMIERAIHTTYGSSRIAMETELLLYIQKANQSGDSKEWLSCPDTSLTHCTSLWAEESWQHALQWAYMNSDNQTEVVSGTHLTDEYYETRLPQIKHYLAVAGARLAASLELALSTTNNNALPN